MDSPLNNAHQQSRKADMMVKSGKIEEALLCHRRAAEYLLDAMRLTASVQALESMQLQHQYHLKQQDFLQQRQAKLQHKQNSKTTQRKLVTQSTQTDKQQAVTHEEQMLGELTQQEEAVHHAMTETQSVLGILVNRPKTEVDGKSKLSCEPVVTYTPLNQAQQQKSTFMIKFPRDEKQIAEELKVQNDELRSTVSQLLKELEESRKENRYLKGKIFSLENAESNRKDLFDQCMKDEGDVQLPPIELPPLEMPNFDFQSLNQLGSTNTDIHGDIFSGE